MSHSCSIGSAFEQYGLSDSEHEHPLSFNLASKGMHISYMNKLGIGGDKLSKISE